MVTVFQNLYSNLNASTLNSNRNKPQLLSSYVNCFGIHDNEEKTFESYFTLVPVSLPLFYDIKMSVNTAGVQQHAATKKGKKDVGYQMQGLIQCSRESLGNQWVYCWMLKQPSKSSRLRAGKGKMLLTPFSL